MIPPKSDEERGRESRAAGGKDAPAGRASGRQSGGTGKGFLEERPGHKSAMRAMSFVALLAAIGFGAVTLTEPEAGATGIYVTFGFLLAAFAPKALQKYAEGPIPD